MPGGMANNEGGWVAPPLCGYSGGSDQLPASHTYQDVYAKHRSLHKADSWITLGLSASEPRTEICLNVYIPQQDCYKPFLGKEQTEQPQLRD